MPKKAMTLMDATKKENQFAHPLDSFCMATIYVINPSPASFPHTSGHGERDREREEKEEREREEREREEKEEGEGEGEGEGE